MNSTGNFPVTEKTSDSMHHQITSFVVIRARGISLEYFINFLHHDIDIFVCKLGYD